MASGKPRTPYVRLATIGDVRAEMGAIYRLAKSGQLPWKDASRAINGCLEPIARRIESEHEEARRARDEADTQQTLVTYGLAAPNGSERCGMSANREPSKLSARELWILAAAAVAVLAMAVAA